jgi:hypothetical protein
MALPKNKKPAPKGKQMMDDQEMPMKGKKKPGKPFPPKKKG